MSRTHGKGAIGPLSTPREAAEAGWLGGMEQRTGVLSGYSAHKAKIDTARNRGIIDMADRYVQRDANRHDYEPGEVHGHMTTDPDCRMCGQPKKAAIHDV